MKKLIIVSGRPGTGKTYIANKIVEYMKNLDMISYDYLKEKNYDEFGFNDIEEKKLVDLISLKEFIFNIEKLMILNRNIIIEYPFSYKQKVYIEELINEYEYSPYTIRLVADSDVLLDRIITRDTDINRHLGHIVTKYNKLTKLMNRIDADALFNKTSFEKICLERDYDNFCIGELLEIDTTEIEKIDFNIIYRFINKE